MKVIKLYHLLTQLSKPELRKFQLFVSSPYFNQNLDVNAYLSILLPLYPEFNISDDELYRLAFPETAFKAGRLSVLRTYLIRLFEQFLTIRQLESRPYIQESLLIDSLTDMELFELAEQKVNKALEENLKEPPVKIEEVERAYYLKDVKLNLLIKRGSRTAISEDELPIQSLDSAYLARKLKLLAAMENNGRVLKYMEENSGVWETMAIAERTGALEHPLVRMYYLLLTIQLRPSSGQALHQFYSLIDEHQGRIPKDELYNLFGTLVNKFLGDLRKGIAGSLRKAFTHFQRMDELNLIFGMGQITHQLVRNAVSAGARLGEFKWTEDLLNRAMDKFPQAERAPVYHFGKAQLAFHQKDYSGAQKHLLEVDFGDPMIKISAQNLLLKCYYETRETDALISLQESMRRYLSRRKEFTARYREAYLNFLTLIKYLYDLRWELSGRYSAEQLNQKLDQYELFFNRDWVREQLIRL